MSLSDHAIIGEKGETCWGIHLNAKNLEMDVSKDGNGVLMKLDPRLIEEFKRGDFSGVVRVIINITPIASPVPYWA